MPRSLSCTQNTYGNVIQLPVGLGTLNLAGTVYTCSIKHPILDLDAKCRLQGKIYWLSTIFIISKPPPYFDFMYSFNCIPDFGSVRDVHAARLNEWEKQFGNA
jgi:hypothetical protein